MDRLFERALDLPERERERLLSQAAREDPDLAAEVRELLAAAGEDVLAAHAADVRAGLDAAFRLSERAGPGGPAPVTARAGDRIGPYRLVRLLGRGGMGAVFLAERADGAFEQRVALKILRADRHSGGVLARFRAERQILASLDHPAIARLLDGGRSADGRPYLAMEYVAGSPITEHCLRAGLSLAERLRLFRVVGRAVQHAHRRLIVHRDLKPSNVLVTPDGRVKLLDFGIAKILEESGIPARSPATATGAGVLTPEYASPEQLRGGEVTTASDVYQLGQLLFEMLTGRRPCEPEDRSLAALERAICEREPPAPSEAVRGRGATGRTADVGTPVPRHLLEGDVDRIVLMALRKEPERRYATAEQLVEDVERHLAGRPVRARGDAWGYRARKFVGRNRWPVAAVAAGIAALGTWAATLQVHSRQLEAERDRARAEAAESRQVREFLTSLFRVANPARTRGEEVTARELLDAGAARVRRDLGDQPAVRAEMLATIGEVYGELGLFTRALELSEEAWEIRREVLPADHPDRAEGLTQLARARGQLRTPSADSTLRAAVDAVRRVHGPDDPRLATALTDYAMHSRSLSNAERWELFDRAIEILESAPGDHRGHLADVLVSSSYWNPPPDPEEGTDRVERALALRQELYGPDHPAVARTLSDLAFRVESRSPPAAEVLLRRALEIHRETAGERHTTTLTIANNLAGMLRDRGIHAPAESLYREVLAGRRAGAYDPITLAYPLYGLGRTLVEMGRGAEAEPYLREVLELDVFPEGDPRRVITRATLGWALARQDRAREAIELLRAARSEALGSPGAEWTLPFIEERLDELGAAGGPEEAYGDDRHPSEEERSGPAPANSAS